MSVETMLRLVLAGRDELAARVALIATAHSGQVIPLSLKKSVGSVSPGWYRPRYQSPLEPVTYSDVV
jgi:hypothetical protein